MFNSLRFRLMLIFICLAIGPLILVEIIIGPRNFTALEKQSLNLQRQIASTIGGKVKAFIEQRTDELVALNEVYGLGLRDREEQEIILDTLLLHQRVYQAITLLDAAGNVQFQLSLSDTSGEKILENRAKEKVFLVPLTQKQPYFSPVRFDETVREPLVTISVPLVDLRTQEVVSILVADLRFRAVWNLLAEMEPSSISEIYVTDAAGRIIAHRNPSIVLRGTTIALPENQDRATGIFGTDVIIATQVLQFSQQKFIVVAEQPISEALKRAISSRRITIVATSTALILAIALVIFITGRIVKPIEALAKSAQAISNGDFSRRVLVPNRDEIYDLAQAFNKMSSQLQQTLIGLEEEVSERKRAQEALEDYSERLEEMVEQRTQELQAAQVELLRRERLSVLGQLAATVAHEIRNPLGTVRTSVFSIGHAIERNQMKRVGRALQLAERNIVRCDNIIHELLNYARDRVLRLEPTKLDAWLEEILEEQPIPPNITYNQYLNTGLDIPLDRQHLRRAVINVVDNALHALEHQDASDNKLTISTHIVKNQAQSRLEIRISDSGCGIPSEELTKIFEPLVSTKTFGVGLGLPIVKGILEDHSGGVEIQSKVAQGTTVILWLPLS